MSHWSDPQANSSSPCVITSKRRGRLDPLNNGSFSIVWHFLWMTSYRHTDKQKYRHQTFAAFSYGCSQGNNWCKIIAGFKKNSVKPLKSCSTQTTYTNDRYNRMDLILSWCTLLTYVGKNIEPFDTLSHIKINEHYDILTLLALLPAVLDRACKTWP